MCVFSICPLHACLGVCYRGTIKAKCFNVVEDGKCIRERRHYGENSAGLLEKTSGLTSGTSRAGCATWCDNALMLSGHYLPPPEIWSLTFTISVNTTMRFIFINPANVAAALLLAVWPLWFPLVDDSFTWILPSSPLSRAESAKQRALFHPPTHWFLGQDGDHGRLLQLVKGLE